MIEWKEYKLSDIAVFSSGGTPSKSKQEYWSGNIPWISALSMGTNRLSTSDLKITQEGLHSGSRLAKKNSILLLVRGGALHKRIPVGIALNDVAFNQDVKAIEVNTEILNPWYLLYWFIGHEKFLLQKVENTGIGAGKLDTKILNDLTIKIPPNFLMDKIVSIIKSIDDKIETNQQINQTLEAMAQALFKSWFVDFEPVKAKIAAKAAGADAEGMTLAAMEALSGQNAEALARMAQTEPDRYAELKTTAQLFPDALVDSELGEIPVGWDIVKIGEITKTFDYVANGSFASLKENVNLYDEINEVLYIRTTDFNKGFSGQLKYTDKKSYDFLSKSKLERDHIIISNVGDVGTVFRPPSWLNKPMTLGSNAIGIKSSNASHYIYWLFRSKIGQYLISSIVTGSAQLKFNKTNFRSLNIIYPNKSILKNFEKICLNFDGLIVAREYDTLLLTQLRDTLLPKLLSGEVSVADV